MYRANWLAMAANKEAIFKGPIGQQVYKDLMTDTSAESKRNFNDVNVIERATQLVESGVITVDAAAKKLASMFSGAVAHNNRINNYEAVGLSPQGSYLSTIGVGFSNFMGRMFPSRVGSWASQKTVTELPQGVSSDPRIKQAVVSVDLTSESTVRRLLLGELVAGRVQTLKETVPAASLRAAAGGSDSQITGPEQ